MATRTGLQWGERSMHRVGGVDVHVEQLAGPGRRLVVGLHGFASGTFTWAGVARSLSSVAPVVAWDRPPFGRSARPMPTRGAGDPYAVGAELDRSAALTMAHASETESDGVILVGHSAGALLAVQLAHAASVPVAGLVLIAPALAGEPPALVRRVARAPAVGVIGGAALGVALRAAGPALRAASRHPSPLVEATAAETAHLLRRPGTARALWHLTATWQPPAILDELGPLGVPTTVIVGRNDRISPPEPSIEMAQRLGAEVHVLDGVGHAPHEQRPEQVGEMLAGFVRSLG